MTRAACLMAKAEPLKLIDMVLSKASMSMSRILPTGPVIPALLCMMSRVPYFSMAKANCFLLMLFDPHVAVPVTGFVWADGSRNLNTQFVLNVCDHNKRSILRE
ncbi:hypothetical protein HYC85_032351 [Camellia sinensis]|uniref:Uncharacterized protein n=1 Tax=Camellia sinensis TaxID=4442 RepID=A0A7J7FUY8_CAMSI|nr:hypothetical protein HYC85_032351 [Camellia sinensis]